MHQGTPLNARENAPIDVLELFFFTEDQSATRAPQRLVRGACDEVGNRNWAIVNPCRHQTRVVGHVDHQQRTDFPSNLGEPVVRNLSRISAGTRNDQLRLVLAGERSDLVEVESVVLVIDAIEVKVVELTADIQSHPVGQVSTLGQVQTEHRIARLEAAQVDGGVGL